VTTAKENKSQNAAMQAMTYGLANPLLCLYPAKKSLEPTAQKAPMAQFCGGERKPKVRAADAPG
jgi:hypothetical protein